VSHGEGRAYFAPPTSLEACVAANGVALAYVDNAHHRHPTQRYPANPNGSPGGVAGVSSSTGRALALMPHPERTILADCASYLPPREVLESWGEFGPWRRLFTSARRWVG
jgi:phosphoribosylformylglycinamidine synthase